MDPGLRVVVTGAAAYTVCGLGKEAFWSRLRGGIGANDDLQGEVSPRTPPPETLLGHRRRIKTDHPLAMRLLAAIKHDLGQFLEELTAEEREHVGVALGSAYAHLGSYFAYYQTGTERGYQFVNPRHFPSTLPNFFAVEVNDAYSLWGSSTTIGSGLAAGLEAIGYAAASIKQGQETAMLAGGLDEVNDFNQHLLEATRLRSASGLVRPFATDRDGTVPGEAVAVLLLQSEQSARASQRKPLAEVCGTASAKRVFWDSPSAQRKAVEAIGCMLESAGAKPSDIDAVFPSVSGTIQGDEFERELLGKVFGERLESVLVVPVKHIAGECFAASGPLQCLAAVCAVAFSSQGPLLGIRLARNGAKPQWAEQISPVSTALVYSAGYDGTFSVLAVRRYAA